MGLSLWGWGLVVGRFVLSMIALMQLPPAMLWVQFHGRGISDGIPPSDFTAHWALALPYLMVAGLWSIYTLVASQKEQLQARRS